MPPFPLFATDIPVAKSRNGGIFHCPASTQGRLPRHDVGMEKLTASPAALEAFEALAADTADAGVTVGKMFGATSLMVGGKAIGCLHGDGVAFKLGRESAAHASAMRLPGAALFDPSGIGRPFKDWVLVPLGSAGEWESLAAAALAALNG